MRRTVANQLEPTSRRIGTPSAMLPAHLVETEALRIGLDPFGLVRIGLLELVAVFPGLGDHDA